MKIARHFAYSFLFLVSFSTQSQTLEPYNGTPPSKTEMIALKNARIYVSPDRVIEKGTILIKDRRVFKVGPLFPIPKEALVLDYSGKTIIPGFIECNAPIDSPKTGRTPMQGQQSKNGAVGSYYWNTAIHPEFDLSQDYAFDEKKSKELKEKGFIVVGAYEANGIARGYSSVFALEKGQNNLLRENAVAHFSFSKGHSNQAYPSSLMGSIALLRQALYDAKWYDNAEDRENNLSLAALNKQLKGTILFEIREKQEILRAEKIAREFNLQFNYITSGDSYQLGDDLEQLKSTLVIPVKLPEAYETNDPYVAREIPLGELKHWEMAPCNMYLLSQKGITVALSSADLKAKDFWSSLQNIRSCGLTEGDILKALTETPAKLLGIEKDYGSLEKNMIANFVVYDENPFDKKAEVLECWTNGKQEIFKRPQTVDVRGTYNLIIDNEYLQLEISGSLEKPKGKLSKKTTPSPAPTKKRSLRSLRKKPIDELKQEISANCEISVNDRDLSIQFFSSDFKWKGSNSLHGKISTKLGVIEGDALLADGQWVKWSAVKSQKAAKEKKEKEEHPEVERQLNLSYPNMAYGFSSKPQQETVVIKNATLWTNEKDGIVSNGTVIIQNGKITFAGAGNYVVPRDATVYDAKGKHVTSGIIDEHSHIAIKRGVNEGTQAISAEVSIGDVVDPEDIDIYRQLSGGVTAAQLLHGSANPIGGQSALIKLKWGHNANEMLIPDADKFIKFALGENVKQTNWGDAFRNRFPQTRMGVEQVYYDAFSRARQYEEEKKKHPGSYRVDLELEALAEILNKKRFITCHSYIQSEINMLMKVADSMGFTLNTFTHILEGYKVADKMKKHGAGASTFSDWWAYKYEVNDAIPYNAALLNEMGIVTALNSDDAEMGRRLNQEAAKAVKYGGASEEDAWKMVTLNPAKLLHLDQRMGSLKAGKDGDIVLWSHNPLSIEARVEMTIVDGEILFDAKRDEKMRQEIALEKARIISLMKQAAEKGARTKIYTPKSKGHFHCNTLGEDASHEENQH